MNRSVFFAAGLAIAWLLAAPVDAGEEVFGNCAVLPDRDACLVRAVGADSAEWHAKNGYGLVRLIEWNAFNGVEAFVDFVRTPQGDSWMIARNTGGSEISIPISAADWNGIAGDWTKFAAGGYDPVPVPEPRPGPGTLEQVTVCTDAWSATVEVAIGGKVVRRSADSCGNQDGEFDLVRALYDKAVGETSFCAKLNERFRILQQCLHLEGDKYEAADIANASEPLWGHVCGRDGVKPKLEALFADTALLRIAGQADIRGRAQVAPALLEFLCDKSGYLQYELFDGTPQGGRVTGVAGRALERDKPKPDGDQLIYYSAPLDIVWARTKSGELQIVELDIGAFAALN
jgi:hypothetical protein